MRLIDADALIKEYPQASGLKLVIENAPTAYDIEKVAAELYNAESVKLFGSLNSGNRLIPVSDAIDIVRKGGVE